MRQLDAGKEGANAGKTWPAPKSKGRHFFSLADLKPGCYIKSLQDLTD